MVLLLLHKRKQFIPLAPVGLFDHSFSSIALASFSHFSCFVSYLLISVLEKKVSLGHNKLTSGGMVALLFPILLQNTKHIKDFPG